MMIILIIAIVAIVGLSMYLLKSSGLLSVVSNYVATLGQSIQFVAFIAHSAVSFILVEHLPMRQWLTALLITIYAGIKEYYFDARYEKNPPQTFKDNTEDFLGYVLGAWLAVILL